MSRTFRNTDSGKRVDKDEFTRNKRKRDIGQNKRIKKDYLKNKEDEDN